MARFKCTIRRFCTAGFEFQDGEMVIPDTDTKRLALWREVWANLSLKYRGRITEVTEFDSDHKPILSRAIRGITGANVQNIDPGSTEKKPGSIPDQFAGAAPLTSHPNSIPAAADTKPKDPFDHDGDGKPGGSLPHPAKPTIKVVL